MRFSNLEGQRTRMHSRILRHNACSQTDEPNCAPHGRGKKEINPPPSENCFTHHARASVCTRKDLCDGTMHGIARRAVSRRGHISGEMNFLSFPGVAVRPHAMSCHHACARVSKTGLGDCAHYTYICTHATASKARAQAADSRMAGPAPAMRTHSSAIRAPAAASSLSLRSASVSMARREWS